MLDKMNARDVALAERRVRRLARKHGCGVAKSRARISLDNRGDYQLFDSDGNFIVLGSRFDATIDEIKDYLTEACNET